MNVQVARKARVFVSTPEKWDTLTRRWMENSWLLSNLKLVLIDEVHILNEPGRGKLHHRHTRTQEAVS